MSSSVDRSDTLPLASMPSLAREHVALLFYGRRGATAVRLSKGESIVVGRSAPAEVAVGDESVSREHARFTVGAHGELRVEDLGSTNGVIVDGRRVATADLVGNEQVMLGAVSVGIHRLAAGAKKLKGLVSHDEFLARLEDEVGRSEEFRRPLSVALLRAPGHVDSVMTAVMAALRRVDRAGMYSDSVVELLLPETSAEEALIRLEELLAGAPKLAIALVSTPVDGRSSDELLARATRSLAKAAAGEVRRNQDAPPADDHEGPVIRSAPMRDLFAMVERAARARLPVLVRGETGAGKEVVARALHERGTRRGRPLVCVNCGALPQHLVESTLFGHEKGAFTGADAAREGVFEAANGGTVFLDEVGELPLSAQVALLRVLETGRITRVGGTREVVVDTRVVAATHRNLEERVARGEFREDLLFRLNALTLDVPALRERREEIPDLALRFLERASRDNGVALTGIEDDALEALRNHTWPGNVRELKNAIDRAVVVARGDRITVADLPERVLAARAPATDLHSTLDIAAEEVEADYKQQMRLLERRLLLRALDRVGGVQTEAAKRLDMPLRTFVHKLKVLGIRRVKGGYDVVDD